jgi:hypothetical protein
MSERDEVFVFLSPDVERFLIDNEIDIRELISRTGQRVDVRRGTDPASTSAGSKEPVTILLASAAIIAVATPLLRDLLHTLSGRDAVIRERRLLPVEDSSGNVVRNAKGEATLHWVDAVKSVPNVQKPQAVNVKGWGIEISFREK